MLGTIIYAALDISLNTTIWMIKTASNGIYYSVNYFLGYDTEDQTEDQTEDFLDTRSSLSEIRPVGPFTFLNLAQPPNSH